MFSGLDVYYADPAQPLTTAGEELDYLDDDLSKVSHLSHRGVKSYHFFGRYLWFHRTAVPFRVHIT